MQSSAVMSIKTPHALSNIANPSAASYLAPILHIDTARHHRKPPRRTTAPRRSSGVAHQVKPAPNIAEPSPYSSQTPSRSPLEIASRHARFSEVSHIKRAADHSPMQPHITHITKTHRASRRCERSPRIGRPCRWRRHSISLPGRAGNRPTAGDAHHLELFVRGLACERAARAICSFPPLDAISGTL